MGRYLRWSKCQHCAQKITQNISAGNWHPAFGGRTSKTIQCGLSPTYRHEPTPTQEGQVER